MIETTILAVFAVGVIIYLYNRHGKEVDRINNNWANRIERVQGEARLEREDLLNRLISYSDPQAKAQYDDLKDPEQTHTPTYVGGEHEGRGGWLNGQANET